MTVALYSRSYWDVLVAVAPSLVAGGKGKVDAPSTVRAGGFAWNAARTLAGSVAVRIVTVAPAGEGARLAAEVPTGATLEVLAASGAGWLPMTVVLDPGGQCRILRDPGAGLDAAWRAAAVSATTAAAAVHVLGRLPAGFAADVVAAAHARGARVGWCGGADVAPALEAALDLVCVNAREAAALIGDPAASVADCARALAARATGADAVRVVTGGGGQPTIAVHKLDGALDVHAIAPAPIDPSEIRTLLGAGDGFAAGFMRTACLDADGVPRPRLAVAAGLAAGQAAARAVMTGGGAGG
ncbi:MAG: hypothetical protein IPL61_22120 [Myxococcales bacterium]|nr:hypothetical protein [Myxococcales bacterium]